VKRLYLLTVGALLLMVAVGCGGKSRQEPVPMGPTGEPADAETINRMVDDAAQYIAMQLPQTPTVRQAKYRQVLGIGPIHVSGFASPVRYADALSSLQAKLLANESLQNSFRMIVTSSPDAIEVVREVGGEQMSFQDPRGNDPQSSKPQQYKAEDVFVLSGNFTRLRSDSESRFYRLIVQVVHPHSRQTVLSREFQANFKWDEEKQQWRSVR
jgi:hypothetical protein